MLKAIRKGIGTHRDFGEHRRLPIETPSSSNEAIECKLRSNRLFLDQIIPEVFDMDPTDEKANEISQPEAYPPITLLQESLEKGRCHPFIQQAIGQ